MKKIEATVRPLAFSAVKEALQGIGIHVMTISRVETIGQQLSHREFYRGTDVLVESKPSVKIEVLVDDALSARTRDTIIGACRTANAGTGKILVTHIDEAIDLNSVNLIDHTAEQDFTTSRERPRVQKIA